MHCRDVMVQAQFASCLVLQVACQAFSDVLQLLSKVERKL